MLDSLQPHGLQHTRFPCPSLSPRACLNSCPLMSDAIQTSHPLLPPSPPALNLSQHQGLFQWANSVSGGQSIGLSASASVLPVNIQGRFPSELTGLISLLSKGVSRVFSSITIQKYQFFSTQPSLWSNSHIRTWLLEKLYVRNESRVQIIFYSSKFFLFQKAIVFVLVMLSPFIWCINWANLSISTKMSTEIIDITFKLSLQYQVPQTVKKMFFSIWVLLISMSFSNFFVGSSVWLTRSLVGFGPKYFIFLILLK